MTFLHAADDIQTLSRTRLDAMLDHTYHIKDVMNGNPVTMADSGTVRDAAQILSTHGFQSVPVVDGKKLIGIGTASDLIRYLVDQYKCVNR